jgi:hypothetical protein
LLRDTLANFADIDIGREWVMRVGHAWLLTPVNSHNGESNGRFLWRLMCGARLSKKRGCYTVISGSRVAEIS